MVKNKSFYKFFILILLIILLILFFKKNNTEFFNNTKYLMFTGTLGSYGISHHKSNLSRFILKARELNKILIIPNFSLHAKHNNGHEINSNLSKYIDYNNLIYNGEKIKVIFKDYDINKIDRNDITIYNLNKLQEEIRGDKGLIRYHKDYIHLLDSHDIDKNIKYNNPIEIKNIGLNISKKLGYYTCIHIRRRDRNDKTIDTYTKSDNIIKKLKESNSPKNVYIMTDEPNLEIFDKVKLFYNVFYYLDFKELKSIKNDNYYLFQVENEIMDKANIKISTFKTNNSKYNNYLVNKIGYQ